MNIELINDVVRRCVKNKYEVIASHSKTTTSYYVVIRNGKYSVKMRFADHMTKADHLKTFMITEKTFTKRKKQDIRQLEAFVKNNIKSLERTSFYRGLDFVSGTNYAKQYAISRAKPTKRCALA